MKASLVALDYQGLTVSFNEDGWFNATAAAAHYGKRLDHYLANAETQDYIAALCEGGNPRKVGDFVRTQRGRNGGTWFHPDLGVHFARWLDARFAIWCDRQIRALLKGQHPHFDWKRLRHKASSSFKVMQDILAESANRDQAASAFIRHVLEQYLYGCRGRPDAHRSAEERMP